MEPLAHLINMEVVIAKRYQLKKIIGTGGFGEVYRAFDKKINKEVAIKLEKRTEWNPILHYESKILEYLRDIEGIPEVIEWGFQGDYNYLSMGLAGVSLEAKLIQCGGKFSKKVKKRKFKERLLFWLE